MTARLLPSVSCLGDISDEDQHGGTPATDRLHFDSQSKRVQVPLADF